MRHNQSFLNRVSFRRRAPPRVAQVNTTNNSNAQSMPNSTISAIRTCIDTLSESTSITPSTSVLGPHEGSSSGRDSLLENSFWSSVVMIRYGRRSSLLCE